MNKELKEKFVEWLEEVNLFCFEIEHCKACPFAKGYGCRLLKAFGELKTKPRNWDITEVENLL